MRETKYGNRPLLRILQTKLDPLNHEHQRVVRIPAHGAPEFASGDECVRSSEIHVSPFSGEHVTSPFGPKGGSRAKGGSRVLLLLFPRQPRGASTRMCTGGD